LPGSGQSKPASDATTGLPVDQIVCQAGEQTLFHIHAYFGHLRERHGAAGTGRDRHPGAGRGDRARPVHRAGARSYWLHTYAADGIIHIESAVQRTYSLGEFFDEWG